MYTKLSVTKIIARSCSLLRITIVVFAHNNNNKTFREVLEMFLFLVKNLFRHAIQVEPIISAYANAVKIFHRRLVLETKMIWTFLITISNAYYLVQNKMQSNEFVFFFFKIVTSKLKHAFLVYLLLYEALIIRTFKVFGKTLLWFSSGSTQHIPSHFTLSTRHLVLKCIAVYFRGRNTLCSNSM